MPNVEASNAHESTPNYILENKKAPSPCDDGASNFGSSTWARTRDLRINSPVLYQLSYRGIQPKIIASLFGLFAPLIVPPLPPPAA